LILDRGVFMRLDWVDYAKGIGILLVVYGHVLIGVYDADIGLSDNLYKIQHGIIYGFHMPLFFFLSGLFVEKWRQRNFVLALKQKTISLLYPYFLWALIQGGIMVVLSTYTNNKLKWTELLRLPIDPYAQFWFVYDLFFMFLLYYGLRKIMNTKLLFLFSLIIFIISPYFENWEIDRIGFHFIFFVAGSVLMRFDIQRITNQVNKRIVILMILVLVLTNIIYLSFEFSFVGEHMYNLILAPVGIIFTLVLSVLLSKKRGFYVLKFLGEKSMPIYLVHILAASGVRIILLKFFSIDSTTVHLIIGSIMGICAPLVVYVISNKMNVNGLVFGEFKNGGRLKVRKTA
jgi:fucose 4-O-acetylase-like acetyltransferase